MIYRSCAAPRLKQYPQPNLPQHFALSLPFSFFFLLLTSSAAVPPPHLCYVPVVISVSCCFQSNIFFIFYRCSISFSLHALFHDVDLPTMQIGVFPPLFTILLYRLIAHKLLFFFSVPDYTKSTVTKLLIGRYKHFGL